MPRRIRLAGLCSGLSGTVVLQDNGGDDLSVSGNGAFTFGSAVADRAGYDGDGEDESFGAVLRGLQRLGHGGRRERRQRRGLLHE